MSQTLGPRQQALVDALRSGDYSQGQRRLRINNSFCCLGVACDLSKLAEWKSPSEDSIHVASSFDNEFSILPESVREFYAFRSSAGEVALEYINQDSDEMALTRMNDDGWTFHAIAKALESEPEKYFEEPK